jgi:hypothetical protein
MCVPATRSAFVLWKTLEMWQQRTGLGNSPRTLLEEFARLGMVLPKCLRMLDADLAAVLSA